MEAVTDRRPCATTRVHESLVTKLYARHLKADIHFDRVTDILHEVLIKMVFFVLASYNT